MQADPIQVVVLAHCAQPMRNVLTETFGSQCRFHFIEDGTRPTAEQLHTAEILIGEPEQSELAQTEHLRLLQLTWAGADKYTRMTHLPEGMTLANASGAFGGIIAEYVIGSLIALYRAFPQYCRNQTQHIWQKYDQSETIAGKTALILGMGDIGANTARRLKAFGAYVLGVKRTAAVTLPPDFDEAYTLAELDTLLPRADILIGCLPNTPETAGLLTAERLGRLKTDALLVNVGRGSLVKTADLVAALQSGAIGGAALDVTETEPLPPDCPLWDMENVLLTPHIAGPSFGGNHAVERTIWNICMENLRRYLSHLPLQNTVDIPKGY